MRKAIRAIALTGAIMVVAALGVTAYAANSRGGTPTPVATVSPSTGDDVKGNCDEAEHANDPECQGVTPMLEDNQNDDDGDVEDHDDGDVDDQGDDTSGPNDSSGPENGDDEQIGDNSGPSDDSGSGDDDDDDDARDDHGGDDSDSGGVDDLIRG